MSRLNPLVALFVLLGGGVALARELESDDLALHTTLARGVVREPAIRVRLVEGNRLLVQKKGEWTATSLAGLSKHLRGRIREDRRRRMPRGLSAVEYRRGGLSVSRLFVQLEVHRAIAWEHVGWVTTIFGEEKLDKISLRVGGRRLNLILPVERSVYPTGKDPPPRRYAWVRMRAHGGAASYRVGTREFRSLGEVAREVSRIRSRAIAARKEHELFGVLETDGRVTAERAFAALETLWKVGVRRGFFTNARYPGPGARTALVLPAPKARK